MQKISPFLWFDKETEEAINFYTSIFNNSKVVNIKRYPNGPLEGPWKGLENKVLTAVFELEGQKFMALDGGPYFKFNPAVSLTVTCDSPEKAHQLYEKLSQGGQVMMAMGKYPWSEAYGWFSDKYGVSWQINSEKEGGKIVPSMMFVGDKFGKVTEALNFYTSIFKNSEIKMVAKYEKGEGDVEGMVKYSLFLLEGQPFVAMESSLDHKFSASGAISFYVECQDQNEVDHYWDKLTEGGDPKEQQCGWLRDKYGFSWQIIPTALTKLLSDPDKVKADRAMQAMLKMKKIIVKDLETAVNQ